MFLEKCAQGGVYQFKMDVTPSSKKSIMTKINTCANPICQCGEIEIRLFSEGEIVGEVSAHVFDEKILPLSSTTKGFDDNHLIQTLSASLQKEDWTNFRENYLRVKRQATERIDTNTAKVQFPMAKEIEQYGELVGFTLILPYAEAFWIIEDDVAILIDDQYCLRSGCECTRAFASFISIKEMKQVDCVPPGIFIDYKTGKFEIEFEGEPAQHVNVLFDKLQRSQPELLGKLRRRHETLKALYTNFCLTRGRTIASSGRSNVGRNELCLCGSGKKSKKCCGKNA